MPKSLPKPKRQNCYLTFISSNSSSTNCAEITSLLFRKLAKCTSTQGPLHLLVLCLESATPQSHRTHTHTHTLSLIFFFYVFAQISSQNPTLTTPEKIHHTHTYSCRYLLILILLVFISTILLTYS